MTPRILEQAAAPRLLGQAFLVLAAAAALGCSERVAGGSTEIGNSVPVAGIVVDEHGKPAVGCRVNLVPLSFNPALGDYLPYAWTTRTDSTGAYRIEKAVPGIYNIEVEDSSEIALALIQGVIVSSARNGQVLSQPRAILTLPASIGIPLDSPSPGAAFYIPGTHVLAVPDSQAWAAGKVLLEKVPAGRYSEIVHYLPEVFSRNILGREIEVEAGAKVALEPFHAWSHLHRVSVNTTSTGALLAENLIGFPLLVRLDKGSFDFAGAKRSGEDIRIVKEDGRTPLPFEIEYWDALNGQGAIWVRMDTVHAGKSAQSFLLYSGNPDATGRSAPESVFDTSDGFAGVWHMRENLMDATAFGNDATAIGAPPATGLIGLACSFDGVGQHLSIADHPSLDFGTGDFLASAFVQPSAFGTTAQVFAKRSPDAAFEIQLSRDAKATALIDTGGAPFNLYGKTALKAGEWYQVALLRSGGKASLYLNGNLEAGPVDLARDVSSDSDLLVGADPMLLDGERFHGKIDEVRMSRAARTPGWIRFSYETERTGSRAVTVTRVSK